MEATSLSLIHPANTVQSLHTAHRRKNNRHPMHTMQTERLSLNEEAKLVYVQEMATMSNKTPVSVLQELLSRRGITPKYELVQIEGAIHEPIFRYRVFINAELVATGTGRSKKDAKHAAAKNLLDLLVGKQSPEQANQTNGTPGAADITAQVVSPYDDKVMGNPIGWLQEMCMSRRWPPPSYHMQHEEGLPHERQFTISCHVLKFQQEGDGKSKKLAKRLAAHKMWQFLQDLPPDFEEDEEVGVGVSVSVMIASGSKDFSGKVNNLQGRYAGLKDSKITKLGTQHSHKVTQFHKMLKQSVGPKLAELQIVPLNGKDVSYVQFLQEIALEQQFEITFVDIEEKSLSGKHQCLVQLSTLPVAVCFGTGMSLTDAKTVAAHNALEYLRIMTKK